MKCVRCSTEINVDHSPNTAMVMHSPLCPTDLQYQLKRLYDLEINVRLSSFWDGGWTVEIGDEMNGFTETAGSLTLDEVVGWLSERPVILNDAGD